MKRGEFVLCGGKFEFDIFFELIIRNSIVFIIIIISYNLSQYIPYALSDIARPPL